MLYATTGVVWGLSVIQKLLSDRPILVGGLGLAASLSLLGGLQDILSDGVAFASLFAGGVGLWWWRCRSSESEAGEAFVQLPVDRAAVEAALATLQTPLTTLRQELAAANTSADVSLAEELESQRQDLVQELDRAYLKVAIVGASQTGKTTLIGHLNQAFSGDGAGTVRLTEVGLTPQTPAVTAISPLVLDHDAVIYLVTEDLTDSALADLRLLTTAGQRVMLCWNKYDHFLPDDRKVVLGQITVRLQSLSQPVKAAAIATAPKPLKVRTHTDNGQVHERLEIQPPDVAPLVTELSGRWMEEVSHLVTQTVLRHTHQLRRDIQAALNQVRRHQAQPLVEKMQWTAAAAAFASPAPSLDVLAAIAVSGQLVMDLGRVYQQSFSLEQAKAVATELAKIIVKLGLVEVSTQLLTTALKSHAATFAVGGTVQALSAAYLTRLSGDSLIAYFEERALSGHTEAAISIDAISQKVQALLPVMQRTEFLQTLVKQGLQALKVPTTPELTPLVTVEGRPSHPVSMTTAPPVLLQPEESA